MERTGFYKKSSLESTVVRPYIKYSHRRGQGSQEYPIHAPTQYFRTVWSLSKSSGPFETTPKSLGEIVGFVQWEFPTVSMENLNVGVVNLDYKSRVHDKEYYDNHGKTISQSF